MQREGGGGAERVGALGGGLWGCGGVLWDHVDVPGSLPVPVTFNFLLTKKGKNQAAGDSARYENDELVIKTQDLSLDGNVLERSHKRRGGGIKKSSFCIVETHFATRNFQRQPAAVNDMEKSRKQRRGVFEEEMRFSVCIRELSSAWNESECCKCLSLFLNFV